MAATACPVLSCVSHLFEIALQHALECKTEDLQRWFEELQCLRSFPESHDSIVDPGCVKSMNELPKSKTIGVGLDFGEAWVSDDENS